MLQQNAYDFEDLLFNTLIYNFAVFAIRVKSQIKSFISSFRISAHDLKIEKGRYTYTPRGNRICKLSTCHVETEYNVLLDAPL